MPKPGGNPIKKFSFKKDKFSLKLLGGALPHSICNNTVVGLNQGKAPSTKLDFLKTKQIFL